ncbi:MAG: DUF1570 domain-containing protein [Planctomycetaceae bacterium]
MPVRLSLWLPALCGVVLCAAPADADFLIYKVPNRPGANAGAGGDPAAPGGLPGGVSLDNLPPGLRGLVEASGRRAGGPPGAAPVEMKITFQGRFQVNGKLVNYSHPGQREPMIWQLEDRQRWPDAVGRPDGCEIVKSPTTQQEFAKKMGQAGKDPDAMLRTALYSLKKRSGGVPREFYDTVDKVLDVAPQYEAARRVRELKRHFDEPLPDNPALEQELRSYVRRPEMRIASSEHYLLLHNTPERPAKGERKSRAQRRLELLEQAYESFVLFFQSQDVELELPRERLKVVLFNDEEDYLELVASLNPALSSNAGFWDPTRNTLFFNDRHTGPRNKALQAMYDNLERAVDDAKKGRNRGGDTVRFVKTLDVLVDVDRENTDLESVSREATHQLAGSMGLLPRHVVIPSWVREGLAVYFEIPAEATWSGIGAITDQRLALYRALDEDRAQASVDSIVGDQLGDQARLRSFGSQGYAQAWALTHFLLETRVRELLAFYRMLGEMPPDVTLSPLLLSELFARVMGGDPRGVAQEWRQYMRSLKSDVERLKDLGGGGRS